MADRRINYEDSDIFLDHDVKYAVIISLGLPVHNFRGIPIIKSHKYLEYPQWNTILLKKYCTGLGTKGGLLCHGVVSGAALITRQGQLLYSHGDLLCISQDDIRQFQDLFGKAENPGSTYSKEFCITLKSGVTSLHTAYQKTYSSVYATSKGNNGGLTVCNLPYGLLVCVYPAEVNSGNAIKHIEAFCDLMRR